MDGSANEKKDEQRVMNYSFHSQLIQVILVTAGDCIKLLKELWATIHLLYFISIEKDSILRNCKYSFNWIPVSIIDRIVILEELNGYSSLLLTKKWILSIVCFFSLHFVQFINCLKILKIFSRKEETTSEKHGFCWEKLNKLSFISFRFFHYFSKFFIISNLVFFIIGFVFVSVFFLQKCVSTHFFFSLKNHVLWILLTIFLFLHILLFD